MDFIYGLGGLSSGSWISQGGFRIWVGVWDPAFRRAELAGFGRCLEVGFCVCVCVCVSLSLSLSLSL